MYSMPVSGGISNGYHGFGGTTNEHQKPEQGFAFKRRFERVDWRKIASIDVDRISRNLDFHVLQENILNITFCNIETELDMGSVDPNFVKLFKLAQLTIEYLLHSQEFLSTSTAQVEDKLKQSQHENEETINQLEKVKQDLADMKKENHKRKKMLSAQQQMMQSGVNSYHKCAFCAKAFINPSFLTAHVTRRHNASMATSPGNMQLDSTNQQSGMPDSTNQQSAMLNTGVRNTLQEIQDQLKQTQAQLEQEKNTINALKNKEGEKDNNRDSEIRNEMEKWRIKQTEQHKLEMDSIRDMFMKELKEVNEKYSASERAVYQLHKKYGKPSNLGELKDDIELDKDLILQQREEVAKLKEQLSDQLNNVEDAMYKKFDDERKALAKKQKEQDKKHKQELAELKGALLDAQSALEEQKDSNKGEYDKRVSKVLKATEAKQRELDKAVAKIQDMERKQRELLKLNASSTKVAPPIPARQETPVEDDETESDEQDAEPTCEIRQKSPNKPPKPMQAQSQRKPSAPPRSPSPQKARVPSPQKPPVPNSQKLKPPSPVPQIVEQGPTDSELFEDSEVEDGESSELDLSSDSDRNAKTNTLGSTMGSLGATGTGELTLTRSMRLREALKKDPTLLEGMREAIEDILDEQLEEKHGIKPDAEGITTKVFNNKMSTLKQQRQQTHAKKYPKFFDIRQQMLREVDRIAKERMQAKKSSPKPGPSPTKERAVPQSQVKKSKQKRTPPPRPAPRTPSPSKERGPAMSQTLSTTGSATQWDSGEDNSEDYTYSSEEEDLPDYHSLPSNKHNNKNNKNTPSPNSQTKPVSKSIPKSPKATTPKKSSETSFTGFGRGTAAVQFEDEEGGEESEWDSDASELAELSPSKVNAPKRVDAESKGGSVAEIAKSIEQQLQGRGNGKPPAGGVDTMKSTLSPGRDSRSPATPDIQMLEDDAEEDPEDDWSVSSLGENNSDIPQKKQQQKKPVRRGTGGDTDFSTNTYGTSVWGSSSKAASTVNPGGTQGSHTTKSSVSVTSWDSDEDLDLDDL